MAKTLTDLWILMTPCKLLMSLLAIGALLSVSPWRKAGRCLTLPPAGLFLAAGLLSVGTWLLLPLEERVPRWHDDGRPLAIIVVLAGAWRSGQVVVANN